MDPRLPRGATFESTNKSFTEQNCRRSEYVVYLPKVPVPQSPMSTRLESAWTTSRIGLDNLCRFYANIVNMQKGKDAKSGHLPPIDILQLLPPEPLGQISSNPEWNRFKTSLNKTLDDLLKLARTTRKGKMINVMTELTNESIFALEDLTKRIFEYDCLQQIRRTPGRRPLLETSIVVESLERITLALERLSERLGTLDDVCKAF